MLEADGEYTGVHSQGVGATIVSCCDAFNAMTTDRPYRRAMTLDEAVAELREKAGTQFNPAAVEALLRVLRAEPTGEPRPGDQRGGGPIALDGGVPL